MPANNSTRFDITEGRIAFVIRVGQVDWTDNQNKVFARLASGPNFISLVKDEHGQLIFTHFSTESGTTILTVDAAATRALPAHRDLPIILSWSVSDRSIGIDVNGSLHREQDMAIPAIIEEEADLP